MELKQEDIKSRLKEALRVLDLDIKKTAKKMQYSESRVTNLRSSHQKITPEIALEFENRLGINAAWLIFNRGEMFMPKMILDPAVGSGGFLGEAISNEDIIKALENREDTLNEIQEEIDFLKKNLQN